MNSNQVIMKQRAGHSGYLQQHDEVIRERREDRSELPPSLTYPWHHLVPLDTVCASAVRPILSGMSEVLNMSPGIGDCAQGNGAKRRRAVRVRRSRPSNFPMASEGGLAERHLARNGIDRAI